jgi:mannose-1-phosphate guanylyltransferase/phosphomannomutase
MTPLLGRPVMEHIIQLLRSHGVDDICVTLCYKPQAVMDYFGGGERLGVRLTYFIEEDPLGTAGSEKLHVPPGAGGLSGHQRGLRL